MRRDGTRRRGNGEFSTLCLLGCTALLLWLAVVLYSFHSGFLHSHANSPTLGALENMINRTEKSLYTKMDRLRHIRTHNAVQNSDIHVIFSTDCSEYQDWQTLVLFHSALAVQQDGPVTRIASGCAADRKAELVSLYAKLFPEYHVHFTPDFKSDGKSDKKYDFYNKPYGVQHWLQYAEPRVRPGVVVALIDPDMIFLRPLTTKVKGQAANIFPSYVTNADVFERVGKGRAVGQLYGLGAPWTREVHRHFNKTGICDPGSPCLSVLEEYGDEHFSVGPPYMLEKTDMVRLVDRWTTLVPRVFAQYPYLLAEMYAYSMAAAHEQLPHLQVHHHMVSSVSAIGEGWKHIDALDITQVCAPPVDGVFFPDKPMPTLMHYCQTYKAGVLGFTKRRLRKNMFTCENDLFLDPTEEVADNILVIPKTTKKKKSKVLEINKHAGFALCVVHRAINAALIYFKQQMCEGVSNTSYRQTINVFETMRDD